jgi:acyl carrier protein
MATEELFGINIPDSEASTILTVGDLRDCIVKILRSQGRRDTSSDEVFAQLRDVICYYLKVEPHEVTPEANFVNDLGMD